MILRLFKALNKLFSLFDEILSFEIKFDATWTCWLFTFFDKLKSVQLPLIITVQ